MSKVTKQSHENIDASASRKNRLITKIVRHPAVLAGVLVVVAVATLVVVNAATVRKSVRFGLGGGSLTGTATSQPDGSVAFTSSGGGNVASGKFYVVGKQIIDPDGNIFRPMGANVAVRQAPYLEKNFVFNYFGTANGKSEEVKAWGWNTVRVNVACNITSNPSVSETLAGLDELIKEYTAKKLVVMIDCHDGNITVKDVNYDNPSVQSAMNFFDTLAKAYKNNPYVWFNTVNEPWGSSNIPQWSDLQNKLYARIRANAPDNIFVADLSGGGNAIENLVDGNLHGTYGAGKCNLVYGWHSYGFINGFADDAKHKDYINRLSAMNIPMVVGELGDPLNEFGQPLTALGYPGVAGNPTQNRIGANAVISYAAPAGYGLLWWHATGDTNSSITYSLTTRKIAPWLVNSSNLSELSATGRRYWDVSHQNHILGKFTGNLKNSNCASAQ